MPVESLQPIGDKLPVGAKAHLSYCRNWKTSAGYATRRYPGAPIGQASSSENFAPSNIFGGIYNTDVAKMEAESASTI
jgi:hypothetical protein